MTNPIPGEILRFLADLDEAVTAVIDKHVTTNSKYLQHYAPIGVNVTTVDGVLASFMEEGVEIYPDTEGNLKDLFN